MSHEEITGLNRLGRAAYVVPQQFVGPPASFRAGLYRERHPKKTDPRRAANDKPHLNWGRWSLVAQTFKPLDDCDGMSGPKMYSLGKF